MNLDRVTITGADESVDPGDLIDLSHQYPFVEWGVLVSASRAAARKNRFPGLEWIEMFMNASVRGKMKVSAHICGRWVREILVGNGTFFREPESMILSVAKRVQLNFHAKRAATSPVLFHDLLLKLPGRQFIFQLDGAKGSAVMLEAMRTARRLGSPINAVGLFDRSGGAGVSPDEWPHPIYIVDEGAGRRYSYHGYAGGLGPHNIGVELQRIERAVDLRCSYWIDMERNVRSDDDTKLDLKKVEAVLEFCKPHITGEA